MSLSTAVLAAVLPTALAAAEAADEIVTLPRFVVEAARLARPDAKLPEFLFGRPGTWTYLRFSGFEFLSNLSEGESRRFAADLRRHLVMFELILPASYRFGEMAPTSIVLDQQIFVGLGEGARSALPSAPKAGTTTRMGLSDLDSGVAYFSMLGTRLNSDDPEFVRRREQYSASFTLGHAVLPFVLRRVNPRIPDWIVAGLGVAFRENFFNDGVFSDSYKLEGMAPLEALRALLPMRELMEVKFDRSRHPSMSGPFPAVEAAAWFVRWAMSDEGGARQEAFRRFVEEAATVPVATEELFQKHFGLGFDELDQRITRLWRHSSRSLGIRVPETRPSGEIEMRDATPVEIARILGAYQRLAYAGIPKLRSLLADAAGVTLRYGLEVDSSDPLLLAECGLLEVDAGNDLKARSYLERAIAGGVTRPRVFYELARIQYIEATEALGAGELLLPQEQSEEILTLLTRASLVPPLLEPVHELAARVLVRSRDPHAAEHEAMLARGAEIFPRSETVMLAVARAHAIAGDVPRALAVLARAREFASADADRAQLDEARTTVEKLAGTGLTDPAGCAQALAASGVFGAIDKREAADVRDYRDRAAQAGVVQQRLEFITAQKRFAAAVQEPGRENGRFDSVQMNGVLAQLHVTMNRPPHFAGTYELLADTWLRSVEKPSAEDMARLREGVEFFPGSAALVFKSAQLHAQQGRYAEALAMIEAGLAAVGNPADREQLNRLREAVEAKSDASE